MSSILVIEDDSAINALMALTLRVEDYEVFQARDGKQGLHLAQMHSPDLILMDIMLPYMSGLEVAQILQAEESTSTIAIIFVSAKSEMEDRIRGLDLGADYISKPFAAPELLARVRRVLRNQQVRIPLGAIREGERIERVLEFPPEYMQAGTSILTYFNRILQVKYPNEKVTVRIEQEGLTLRMVIYTPTGKSESIEKTLEEYGLVVKGELSAEIFLVDQFEVIALKNKLSLAELELKQARELFNFVQGSDQKRIESLEDKVEKLHSLIKSGLNNSDRVLQVVERITERENRRYDLRGASFRDFAPGSELRRKEGSMSTFDQRNQQVQSQNNAARDVIVSDGISLGDLQNQPDFIQGLQGLKNELARASQAKIVDGEIAVDVDFEIANAIQQAKKSQPNKHMIVSNLENAKQLVEEITAAAGLVIGIDKLLEAAQKLF